MDYAKFAKDIVEIANGLRYWYFPEARKNYKMALWRFSKIAKVYGDFWSLHANDRDNLIEGFKKALSLEKNATIKAGLSRVLEDISKSENLPACIAKEVAVINSHIQKIYGELNTVLFNKVMTINYGYWNLCYETEIKILPELVSDWPQPPVSPPPVGKEPPMFIIQGNFNYNIPEVETKHPLFDLPFVIPYINWYMDAPDSLDAEAIADGYANKIISVRNAFKLANPNRVFKWSLWTHNFAAWKKPKNNPKDNRLFYHDDDKLSNGQNFIFTAHGRAENKAFMRRFFARLSSVLRSNNIPDPVYMDADYEGGVNLALGDWNTGRSWHEIIMRDPRATTEKIDGHVTYAEYVANLKDLDGNPVSINELYPHIYDMSKNKLVHIYASLLTMVVDYGLHDALYLPAKEVWPNVKCGNYLIHSASRTTHANGYRFKEAPVDAGPGFWGDFQVPSNYGWFPNDINALPTGFGYDTYNECIIRYGINTEGLTPNEIVAKMDLGKFEYLSKGCQEGNPNKPIAMWMKAHIYPMSYRGNDRFPTGFVATLPYTTEHLINIFKVFYRYNVGAVGFFNPEGTISVYDQIYSIASKLHEAGYQMPTHSS